MIVSQPNSSLSNAGFRRFADFITQELGIKMSQAKIPMLQSRLLRRLKALGLNSLDEYQQYLFSSPLGDQERAHFFDAVTTNKTDFYREPRHFEHLLRKTLPSLAAQRHAPWKLKLWCAGCSSGEEPFTLAMALASYAAEKHGFDYSILATDISTRVLASAQQAIYEEEKAKPLPEAWRQRYLMRSRDPAKRLVRVVPELRNRVSFRRLNFMDENYDVREMFDVIFFRNVMIYFDKPTQESVINKLCRNLNRGGYLYVGHSETLAGLNIPIKMTASAVYCKAP